MSENSPYGEGIIAGVVWFNESDNYENYPELSPYPKNSKKDQEWWGGFHTGSGDAEAVYDS